MCYGPDTMRTFLLAALAVALLTNSAAVGYHWVGAGGMSCGTWATDRADSRSGRWLQEIQWVLGFLSAIGYVGDGNDPLNGLDLNEVAGWLDNYCRANPLKGLTEAAEALALEHPR
jgi:hypothetical protein